MRKLILLIFITIYSAIYSQIGKDSLLYSSQSFSEKLLLNSIDKQLNTYNFNTLVKYYISNEKFFWGVKENFLSTIISNSSKNIKDEQYFSALGQYKIDDQIKLGIHLNSNIFSDDRNVGLNKASLLTSSLFVKYNPDPKIQVTPYAGYEQNNQIGENNKGLIFGAEANIDQYDLGDFEINSFLKFQNEDIQPRKNSLQIFSVDLKNNIEDNFTNTISGSYSQQRRDFYFAADATTANEYNITNNIQSRIETNYLIQDRLQLLPSSSPFIFDIQGRIGWRKIDRTTRFISTSNVGSTNYDNKIDEFRLEMNSVLEYATQFVNLAFKFSFAEKDEKYLPEKYSGLTDLIYESRTKLEEQKNNSALLGNLGFTGRFDISDRDRITFDLLQRKLTYDTPSSDNYDDRDELLSIGRILFEHRFNPFFKAFLNIEVSLNKIAYIFSERSANNNTKRTIKLSSGGAFSSGNLTSTNSAEVSANYTVFKYENLNPNYRSFSFRQFAFRDSSQYKISFSTHFLLSGYIKLSEQGDFKWSDFSSRPSRYLTELYWEPKFVHNYFGFIIGVGARYFALSTYNYESNMNKKKISEYQSFGPIGELNYLIVDRISLKFLGWYEFISSEDNTRREMATINFRLSYNL